MKQTLLRHRELARTPDRFAAVLLATILATASTAAHAQDTHAQDATDQVANSQNNQPKGFYGVARGGATIDAGQKLDTAGLPASVTFDRNTKQSIGLTGELGVGYKFGMFRLEQTFGYAGNNASHVTTGDYVGTGSTKALTVMVSGYVDIPTGTRISPYVGVGAGAARVQSQLTRVDQVTGNTSDYSGHSLGLAWHADAGIGYQVSSRITAELGARYTSISNVKFNGQSDGNSVTYKPSMGYWSAMAGARYAF